MLQIKHVIKNSMFGHIARGIMLNATEYGPVLALTTLAYFVGRMSPSLALGFATVVTSWTIVCSYVRDRMRERDLDNLSTATEEEVRRIFQSYREKHSALLKQMGIQLSDDH